MPKRGKSGNKILKPKRGTGSNRIRRPGDPSRWSTNTFTPLFSFEHLDDHYCLRICKIKHKAALIDRLQIMGSLTWQAIVQSPKEQYGYEMIPFEKIKATKPKFLTNDIMEVMVFRFKGKDSRVAGHRQKKNFYILYIDPYLKLYDH